MLSLTIDLLRIRPEVHCRVEPLGAAVFARRLVRKAFERRGARGQRRGLGQVDVVAGARARRIVVLERVRRVRGRVRGERARVCLLEVVADEDVDAEPRREARAPMLKTSRRSARPDSPSSGTRSGIFRPRAAPGFGHPRPIRHASPDCSARWAFCSQHGRVLVKPNSTPPRTPC